MGFKEARARLIEALQEDRYREEQRSDIRKKNLLYTGEVNADFVVRLLRRCDGWEYSASEHHFLKDTRCHAFTPYVGGERWYIKAYLLPDGVAVFISVHR